MTARALAAKIDRYLAKKESPLAGQGAAFVRSGRRWRVDPLLLVAIAGHESVFGRNAYRPFNAWGWGGYTFSSWAEGIEAVAKGLRTNYLDKGLTTISEIGGKYAPIGAGNDPTNLNQHWPGGVGRFYSELGGSGLDSGPGAPSGPLGESVPVVQPLPGSIPSGSSFWQADGKEGAGTGTPGKYHHGALDWFAPPGTPLVAPVGGTIVEVKTPEQVAASSSNPSQVFGGVVKIQMASGMVWVFRHITPLKGLRVGKQVNAGQTIASIFRWATNPSGSHAHIEIWKTLSGGYNMSNLIDPAEVFRSGTLEPYAGTMDLTDSQGYTMADGSGSETAAPLPPLPTPDFGLPIDVGPQSPIGANPMLPGAVRPETSGVARYDPAETWRLVISQSNVSRDTTRYAESLGVTGG